MKCKCGKEMKACGFMYHNRRYECECGKIMIPATSHAISEKFIFNTWTTRKEFYPEWMEKQ